MGSDAGGREVDVVAMVVDGARMSCSKCASAQPSLLVECFDESRQGSERLCPSESQCVCGEVDSLAGALPFKRSTACDV